MLDKISLTADDYVSDGVKLFLFYDFDGVFNVMYRSGTFKKDYYDPTHRQSHSNPHYDVLRQKYFDVNDHRNRKNVPKSYPLVWSNDLVKDSNSLTSRDDVQVVWLTTWRGHMDGVSNRLGFKYNRAPVYLPWGPDEFSSDHFSKVDSFLEYFNGFSNESVGVAWADDVVHRAADLVRKDVYKVSSLTDDNLLLVQPNELYGLSKSEMYDLKLFSDKFLN